LAVTKLVFIFLLGFRNVEVSYALNFSSNWFISLYIKRLPSGNRTVYGKLMGCLTRLWEKGSE